MTKAHGTKEVSPGFAGTRVYLIRHAEAEGNLYRRGQGHYDGLVTQRGFRQIDALAERFKDIEIDALYSSDLSRTRATAGAILKYHPRLELRLDTDLREICMGVWEDQPWGNITRDDREQMVYFNNDPDKWRVEGAETFPALTERISAAICSIAERHRGETVCIVSHGMAIRSFLCKVMGVPSSEINTVRHADNTAVSLLNIDGEQIEIEFFNDGSHLGDELSTFARQTWWKESDGTEENSLHFLPLNPDEESELYCEVYRQTWLKAHGRLDGFNPEPYLRRAREHFHSHPEALVKAMRGDELAGVVDLDINRFASENAGWISLCSLVEGFRGRRMGVQLLGHAVSVFRRLGRKSIRLHVAEDNVDAIGFYGHFGFERRAVERGAGGRILLMEKRMM